MYMQFSFSELNLSFTPIIGVCCASFSSTHSLSTTGSSSPLKRDLFLFAPMGELKPTPYVDLTLQSYVHDTDIFLHLSEC